jgi:rod shape-determining protein MreD
MTHPYRHIIYLSLGVIVATCALVCPWPKSWIIAEPAWFLWVVMACYWGYQTKRSVIAGAWLLGLWQDVLAGGVLGVYGLVNTLIVALLTYLDGAHLHRGMRGRQLVTALILSVAYVVMATIISAFIKGYWPLVWPLLSSCLSTMVGIMGIYFWVLFVRESA